MGKNLKSCFYLNYGKIKSFMFGFRFFLFTSIVTPKVKKNQFFAKGICTWLNEEKIKGVWCVRKKGVIGFQLECKIPPFGSTVPVGNTAKTGFLLHLMTVPVCQERRTGGLGFSCPH